MRQLLGITILLAALYAAIYAAVPARTQAANDFDLARRTGLSAILALGAGILIISGGIDLSIGSVVALSATLGAMLLTELLPGIEPSWRPWVALPVVLAMGAVIGLINGLLVTKLRLPAFIVTLCGLFIYRGVARTISGDMTKGLGNDFEGLKHLFYEDDVWLGNYGFAKSLVIFLVLAAVLAVFLHLSVYGRYLYALGSNERAARFSGIAVDRYKILAYILCSTLASFYGILFLMEHNAVQPSADGNLLELYAIAAAVIGGCSLRGGTGTILGIAIGTAILVMLPNLTNLLGIASELQLIVIGGALLVVAILDEWLRSQRARVG